MNGARMIPAGNGSRMRAARVVSPGKVEIDDVAKPDPDAKQVRIRIEGCGVCASNLGPWQGLPWLTYPLGPGDGGHEAWGIVEDVGRDVKAFKPGDRVAAVSYKSYAEFDVADEAALVRLPPELDGEPFPGEPLGCAVNIFRRSGIRAGETIAIVGIGFLGALVTRLAEASGARVIAISRRPFSLDIARQMGASEIIPMDDHFRIIEKVRELTAGKMCDRVVEAVGKQWPLDLAAELTKERGTLVVAGYHQDGPRQVNMQMWNWRGFDVINAHERETAVYVDGIQTALDAVTKHQINAKPLFTHRYPLEQLGDALNDTANRPDGFMKALITF
jgi:threonine dehydrogenase-like Zn-dependent dehydrogenase